MCEGETERNYFRAIKEDSEFKQMLSAIHPQTVTAKNPSPEQVVKEALNRAKKEKKADNPYDKIWVVFDHDNYPNRKAAYNKAIKENISVAFSAIAFENWYLLHFEKTAKAFPSASSLIKVLNKYYPNYQKAKQNDFAFLKPPLSTANKNAQWLRERMKEEGVSITDSNPWTDVDLLVGELIGINLS